MKNKVISIAAAIIIISACIVASCTKTDTINSASLPANNPKVTQDFTLSWTDGSDTYTAVSEWGSDEFDLYVGTTFLTSASTYDTFPIEETLDNYSLYLKYENVSPDDLTFSITDVSFVDDTTITFKFNLNDVLVTEFVMHGEQGFLNYITNNYEQQQEPNNVQTHVVPHFEEIPCSTAKVVLYCGVECIDTSDPTFDFSALRCYQRLLVHSRSCASSFHSINHSGSNHLFCPIVCSNNP